MRSILLSALMLTSVLTWAQKAKLKTSTDSMSYSLGILIGNNLKKNKIETINEKLFMEAFMAEIKNEQGIMNLDVANNYLQQYFQQQQAIQASKNLETVKKYMDDNAKKEGVKVTESGLQYKIIKEGTGARPSASDKVTVHYHGTLVDGRVFDSSVERNEPIQFPVNGVIAGWTEALQLMNEGSKWILYIPPQLGYGANPMPGSIIEPNSILIFEVELLSVDK